MTQIALICCVAASVTLLIMFGLVALMSIGTQEEISFKTALGAEFSLGLPSRELVNCVFASSDLEFIESQHCKPLLKMFLAERRRLAMNWLRTIKEEVIRVVVEHRSAIKASAVFKPTVELRLAMLLARFFLSYLLLFAMLDFYGPFAARHAVRRWLKVSEGLTNLQTSILVCLTNQPSALHAS